MNHPITTHAGDRTRANPRSEASRPSVFLRSAAVALLAVALTISGCGGAGYSVVRTTAAVDFEPGEWTLLPLEGADDEETAAALAEGMHAGLAEEATNYHFVSRPSVSGEYGVKVTLHTVSQVHEEYHIDATIAFVDAEGRVPDEIRVEITAHGTPSTTALGEELGRRTAHFIHNREQHHL